MRVDFIDFPIKNLRCSSPIVQFVVQSVPSLQFIPQRAEPNVYSNMPKICKFTFEIPSGVYFFSLQRAQNTGEDDLPRSRRFSVFAHSDKRRARSHFCRSLHKKARALPSA